jgi:hypothetical protein
MISLILATSMWLLAVSTKEPPHDRRKQGTTLFVSTSLNDRSDLLSSLSLLHPLFPPWRPLYRYRRAGRRRAWSSPQERMDCQNGYARAPEQTISDVRTMLNAAQGCGRRHRVTAQPCYNSVRRNFHKLSSRRFQTPHYLWFWGNVVGRGFRRGITNRFTAASSSRA